MPTSIAAAATSLHIVSANLNGIRSAHSKGFFRWLAQRENGFEIVCVQELKAQEADLDAQMRAPEGFHATLYPAQKKGYSGVGIYSRQPPERIQRGLGVAEFDAEGRYLRADFPAARDPFSEAVIPPYSVISLYLPSGSAGPERQASKFRFLDIFRPHLAALYAEHQRSGREFVLCGDWNIAHQPLDLKNWKSNQKNSGFLPEERAWFGEMLAQGWVDAWRTLYPEVPGYTWWSNRGQAYVKDVGWRIDYQLVSPGLAARLGHARVYKGQKFSDHAPLIVTYHAIAESTPLRTGGSPP